MHALEHMLFLLSQRIRIDTGNTDLSAVALRLASESHHYERIPGAPDVLGSLHDDWSRRYTAPVPPIESEDR